MLYHEHVVLDNRRVAGLAEYWLPGIDVMSAELGRYKAGGGRSVVSLTNQCMGRDVAALRAISKASGVRIVAATGYYTRPASPEIVDVRAVARGFQHELESSIDESEARAGVIGEIGTGFWPLGDFERDLFAAVALAQVETGAPIATHTHAGLHAEWQLDALTRAGVPPEKIALGHLDEGLGPEAHIEMLARLAGRGAYLGFDTVGITYFSEFMEQQLPSDDDRAAAIARLMAMGLGDRILIAHDICRPSHLESRGGWGYAHIFERFFPTLERHGVDRTAATKLVVDNPLRWLAG